MSSHMLVKLTVFCRTVFGCLLSQSMLSKMCTCLLSEKEKEYMSNISAAKEFCSFSDVFSGETIGVVLRLR